MEKPKLSVQEIDSKILSFKRPSSSIQPCEGSSRPLTPRCEQFDGNLKVCKIGITLREGVPHCPIGKGRVVISSGN